MVMLTIENSVFAYDSYVKNNESVTAVRREFQRHFNIHPNQSVPTHKTIVRWVNAFYTQGTVLDKRPLGAKWTVCSPENEECVRQAMLQSPDRLA